MHFKYSEHKILPVKKELMLEIYIYTNSEFKYNFVAFIFFKKTTCQKLFQIKPFHIVQIKYFNKFILL